MRPLLLLLAGCGLLKGPEEPQDPGCDYEITDYWPFVPEASYPPGALLKVPHMGGGRHPEGYGEAIQLDIAWDFSGVLALTPDEQSVIALPMEEGTYTVRRQSPYCPSDGMDHTLVVQRPPPPPTVAAPALSGAGVVALSAAAAPDGAVYAGMIEAPGGLVRVEVDSVTQDVTAWACGEPCSDHLAYSPSGTWLAHGGALYDRRDGALLTRFSDLAGQPLDVLFLPDDDTALLRSEAGEVVLFDLLTSRREPFAYALDPRIVASPDGLLLIDGTLYDPDTLGLAGTGIGHHLWFWDPSTNRAILSQTPDALTMNLAQVFPPELLGPWGGPCRFTYTDVQIAADPLGRSIVAWGGRNPAPGSDNPWYQTCTVDLATGTLGARQDVPFPYPEDADLLRAAQIAYSADGSLLVVAGLRGLFASPITQ
ncbi:MAG: hypothetical protein KC656_17515 [Myxococcales bacterium]|nr:hypothetical protein [Myxococcales bacterium]MCB9668692.1 hypothetical protein [Alphaproteobacteria bacterium]MCB9691520.1 hypothetical protein [Alphaproteobacteria bacterium]